MFPSSAGRDSKLFAQIHKLFSKLATLFRRSHLECGGPPPLFFHARLALPLDPVFALECLFLFDANLPQEQTHVEPHRARSERKARTAFVTDCCGADLRAANRASRSRRTAASQAAVKNSAAALGGNLAPEH